MSIRFTGLASGLDTDNMIQQLVRIERMKVDRVVKQRTRLEWQQDIWRDMNTKIFNFYANSLSKMRLNGTFNQKSVMSSNSSVATVTGNANSINGMHSLEVKSLAQSAYLTSAKVTHKEIGQNVTLQTRLGDLNTNPPISYEDFIDFNFDSVSGVSSIDDNSTINDLIRVLRVKNNDLNINFDANSSRIFISTKEAANIKIEPEDLGLKDQGLLNALGFLTNYTSIEGSRAEIKYNGVLFDSGTNQFNINGLSINALSIGTTNVLVSQNTEGIYNDVKEFILEYNKLITEINERLHANRAPGFEPLTSEEKAAMTERDIELWEKRIKDSLLIGDNILRGLTSSMRQSLGKNHMELDIRSLSQLGIVTGNYLERGTLHIQGDSDFGLHGSKENKLRKAIEENPEAVARLFNAIGQEMFSDMQQKMRSTQLSSALTFYNDKQMQTRIRNFDDEIARLERRLIQVEDRYYAQFAAMEKAMQAANSKMSWLMQQLGGM